MRLNAKITIILITSSAIMSIILFLVFLSNLKNNQADNIDSFRNEFVELSLELLERNSDLFFDEIDQESEIHNHTQQEIIETVKRVTEESDETVVYNLKERKFVEGLDNPKLIFLFENNIDSLVREELLYGKTDFTIDNYDEFLEGNDNITPAKIYGRIYKDIDLIIAYGKSFDSGKIRIEFIEKQNEEYYRKSFFAAVIVLGLVLLLVPTLSIWLIKKGLVNPILELRDMSKDIAKGNLDRKTSIKSNDEIGGLATDLNKMASELKTSRQRLEINNKSLEKKVGERTKELESKNKELERFSSLVIDREIKMVELKKKIKEFGEKR